MASGNNSATLLTAVACTAFLIVSAALFYVASLDKEVQKLRDEVDALHSICITLQTSLSDRGKNTQGRHYTGDDDDDNNDGYDGDDHYDDEWNNGKNSINRGTSLRYGNPSFKADRHRRDLGLRKPNHGIRSERQAAKNKGKKQERPRGNRRKYKTHVAQFESAAGILNPQEIFTHWMYVNWTNKHMGNKFPLGSSQKDVGKVTITKSGLYYMFVQVTFSGSSGREFAIVKEHASGNKTDIISCCIMVPRHQEGSEKDSYILNTCHTSSLVLLEKGDKVYVKNKIRGGAVYFEPGYTFFGMFKLR